MAIQLSFLLLLALLQFPTHISTYPVSDPDAVAEEVNRSIRNATDAMRDSGFRSCKTGNPIDECWRCDPLWYKKRKHLANCAIGFGKQATGGKYGGFYVVTDSTDNPANPKPGTLRYATIQKRPLWIAFARDMVITLKAELMVSSFKTIDGRGSSVHISGGPCITIQFVSHVIIHGLHIHDCRRGRRSLLDGARGSSSDVPHALGEVLDGDGISVFGSTHVWIDHYSLSNCADGLIDVTYGSTATTVSNNYMTHHDEVMLLGHSDGFVRDKGMQVTVAFNHFGEGLIQRMPRCRHGYFHVVNNDYTHWLKYAIGGSAAPTINSQGNRFLASNNIFTKEVTRRAGAPESEWKKWNWRSQGDMFLNGAFFRISGSRAASSYVKATSMAAKSSSMVASMTAGAGALVCRRGLAC
ncbi:unnamed protein product [Linum trigynum]|uniref:Pectate lyase n=1 Tax=Linum trigynum TaxID=586398 RepID=A0AAV2CVM7_9ROSI